MKKATLIFITLFITSLLYGQKKNNKLLNDSSMAVGVISENCFVSSEWNDYCETNTRKNLSKGDIVVICGVRRCYYSGEILHNYYEVVFDKETYFVDTSKVVTDKTYYEQIEDMTTERADSFKNFALSLGKALYATKLKKALAFIEGCKAKGLLITDWAPSDESDYTQGTSIRMEVLNPTKKTIKYIWFTFIGYNAVDDPIIDPKRGTKSITKQGIGPIEPDAAASYRFEYVWFTDLVSTAIISQIKVQFMDGTIKTIANPKSIMMTNEFHKLLFKE